MFKTVDLDDKIVHLFVVDIDFEADAKTRMYNELHTPIFKKDKVLDPNKRPVL